MVMTQRPEPMPIGSHTRSPVSRRTLLRAAGIGAAGVLSATLLTTDSAGLAVPAPLLERAEWGAYASREPFPDIMSHRILENMVGTRFQRMSWFTTWNMTWPGAGGQQAARHGYDVLLAWQPQLAGGAPVLFTELASGRYDDYLARFFTRAAAHPGNVVIRFAHEPNGSGYPWSVNYREAGGKGVQTTADYVRGWRYVVDFYRSFSRTLPRQDIRFCWCVTTNDKGVAMEEYYPGSDYVDILGVDVYNGYGGYWASAAGLLRKPYARLKALGPAKPVWICEIGCREPSKVEQAGVPADPSKSKADWLRGLFAITDYPDLRAVHFFHANRAFDWRLNSSATALAACREALAR